MPMPPMPQQAPSPQSSFLGAAQQAGSMPPQNTGAQPPMQDGQPQQGLSPQMLAMLKQVAGMGRNGDTTLAHLTPGEKTIPPEIQTPKVLSTLNKAYKDKGVSPEQFTVGSPQSSVNPATGLNEYNFMSAFLPIAMGLAGSFLLPGVGTALGASAGAAGGAAAGAGAGGLLGGLSPLALSSIGGGLGTTAGGLLSGQDPLQAGLSGALGGLGGYGLGSLMGSAAPAAATAASSGGAQAGNSLAGMSAGGQQLASGLPRIPGMAASMGNVGPTVANSANIVPDAGKFLNPEWTKMGGFLKDGFNPMQAAGSVAGSAFGNYLGAPPKPYTPPRPSGFNDKMRPVGSLPPWNEQLGQNTYNGPTPNFSGYNPATNYPAAWRFM